MRKPPVPDFCGYPPCRLPPTVVVEGSDGLAEYRSRAACHQHAERATAWAAGAGGPRRVTVRRVRPDPPPEIPQPTLFD